MTSQELEKYVPKDWAYKHGKTAYIPEWTPPSVNDMLKKDWITWKKKAVEREIGYLLLASGIMNVPRCGKKKRGLVYVIERNRFLDEENLGCSTKIVTDLLRKFGVIHNDSPRWLDLKIIQVHAKKDAQGTNIIVLATEPLEER